MPGPAKPNLLAAAVSRRNLPLTLVIAALIGSAMFALAQLFSPCGAHAQDTCTAGDSEVVTQSFTIEDEFNVGASPAAGTSGQVLTSQGDNTPPEWLDLMTLTSATTADQSLTTATLTVPATGDWNFSGCLNCVYMADLFLQYDEVGTANVSFAFLLPTGATYSCVFNNTSNQAISNETASSLTTTTLTIGAATDAIGYSLRCLIEINGSGTVEFRWAVSTGGQEIILREGSAIRVQRII
jgi:hypothetical protein